jgi:HSP20 family protein
VTGRREFGRLHGEVQELLADLWQLPRLSGLQAGFRPPTDCFRTGDPPRLVVVVDIAGVDPKTIQIAVGERTLLVSGTRERPASPSKTRPSYRQMEIDYGHFERQVPLGDDVDVEDAKATYEHGLLTIVMPVLAKPVRRIRTTIEVRARA